MKLFKIYNSWFIRLVVILLVSGFIFIFFTFKYLFVDETQEQLQFQKKQLLTHDYFFLNPANQLPIEGIFSELSILKGIDSAKTETYYDKTENEYIAFKEIIFYKPYQNKYIKFTIRHSLEELDDLLYTLILSILLLLFLFAILLYFLNKKVSEKLFAPFFNTLQIIKQNQTFASEPLQLPETDIEEFSLLNSTLNKFDNQLRHEYQKVIEFTDNASHELQTPIAIISNRIESILQNTDTDEKTKEELAQIFDKVHQMKKTNETLLLLSRLESRSFENEFEINFNDLLSTKIKSYSQFGLLKNLIIETSFDQTFILKINESLASILINNLLNNAIKHNIEGGYIKISTTNSELIIKNSGKSLQKSTSEMFNRFERDNSETAGIGLGLSLIHEICLLYNLNLIYTEINGIHTIIISK